MDKIIEHPKKGTPQNGRYTHILGRKLEAGEELQAGDVYDSSNGYWEQCPCPGVILQGGVATTWVRPAK